MRPSARLRLLVPLLAGTVLTAGLATGGSAAAASPAPAAGHPVAARPAASVDPALAGATGDVRVVVRTETGRLDAVRARVTALGGRVGTALPLVDGFAATVPAARLSALARTAGVRVVSRDRSLAVQGSAVAAGDTTTAGSLAPRVLRAPDAWAAGVTGAGVTVALVDTGVDQSLPELAGRVVPVRDGLTTAPCYDLSGEGSCRDSFGHGTFMAGLIAGGGPAPVGAAPGAKVISVKVAGETGAADVSTVLAAIQWVVSFRATYGIDVLNLSLGTDSTQSWRDDPLNYAVEKAWAQGILVVVAAANNGPAPGTIAKPGDDPWVVTVGAVDDRGTLGTGDDTVPDFASRGPAQEGMAKPDVVAPGGHVLSLRVPGSTLDKAFPVTTPGPYRRGSGTSMAAALVSGSAALALQAHPSLTPDQLKHALRAAARPVASTDPMAVGSGLVDAATTALRPPAGADNAGLARSTGRGDLGASRGAQLLEVDGAVSTLMTGRQTAQLLLWDPTSMLLGWSPTTWYTSVNAVAGWNTATWAGAVWDGQNWTGQNWTGQNWTGQNWTGQNWTGQNWTGQNWTGQNWTGSSWYGAEDGSTSYGRNGPGSGSYGGWD